MEELHLKINIGNKVFAVAYFNYVKKTLAGLSTWYSCGCDVKMVNDRIIEIFIVYPKTDSEENFKKIVLKRLRTKNTIEY